MSSKNNMPDLEEVFPQKSPLLKRSTSVIQSEMKDKKEGFEGFLQMLNPQNHPANNTLDYLGSNDITVQNLNRPPKNFELESVEKNSDSQIKVEKKIITDFNQEELKLMETFKSLLLTNKPLV